MHLSPPQQAPRMALKDTADQSIRLGPGSPVLLSFFRDASCPFCHKRIQELTREYERLSRYGLKMVAVFPSDPKLVKTYVLARPRPFPVAAEPSHRGHDIYGIERSLPRKLWAVFRRMPMWLGGVCEIGPGGAMRGLCGLNTNNIMPASFLIDENRKIVAAYYGRDAGDHMPIEQIEEHLASHQASGVPEDAPQLDDVVSSSLMEQLDQELETENPAPLPA